MTAGENPFRASRLHEMPFLWPEGETWETLEGRWRDFGFRGTLLGQKGNGKSTLMAEWGRRLESEGWHCQTLRLTEEAPRLPGGFRLSLPPEGGRTCVLLDGAEQLGPLAWLVFRWRTRKAGGLIISSHRPGRLPTLLLLRTRPDQLHTLLGHLLGGDLSPLPASPAELLAARQNDVRLVFRHLYDVFSFNFSRKGVE